MSISAPIIYNSFRVDKFDGEISLPRISEDYYSLYRYDGRGDFYGANINFSSNDILIQFFVDGNIIASDDLDNLKNINFFKDAPFFEVATLFFYNDSHKILYIKPPYPIQFKESIEIKVKANRNSDNRKVNNYRVGLTKESI